MIGSLLFGSLVVAAGGLMMWRHRADLLESRRRDATPREEEFAWRRFRRRMQASAMMGIVGIAIILGQLPMSPLFALFYWGGVALVVLWMVLLAMADALNSYWHFRRLRRHQLRQHAATTGRLRGVRPEEDDPN